MENLALTESTYYILLSLYHPSTVRLVRRW